jgi:S-DNA-T family DNA segregation ATPase FtsK/SpoIIIE
MSALDRGFEFPLLSDEFRAVLARRLRECCGLALVLLAILAATALATWSVHDPSLSHATTARVRNWLGVPGAIVSDLLMQLFGLAAIVVVLPLATWGWRLVTHRVLARERWRVLAWLLSAVLAAGFASAVPHNAAWPLPCGLGGVVGDYFLRLPTFVVGGNLAGSQRLTIAVLLALLTAVSLAVAAGLGLRARPAAKPVKARPKRRVEEPVEEPEPRESRGAVWAGWLTHELLSIKSHAIRLARRAISGRQAAHRPSAPVSERERVEPRFGDFRAGSATVEAPADEEEEETLTIEPLATPRKSARAEPRPAARRNGTGGYILPSLNLLTAAKSGERSAPSLEAIQENATALEGVLEDFGVRGEILNARPGPVVTLYELEPAPGIKSSRVIGLADDIARSMSAISARVAVVSGRNAIGIELPNLTREKVYLRELLAAEDYVDSAAKLPLCLGKTIGGEAVIVDLARMPHLLIAGTTGSGKSVAINTMILSLLYRLKPEQCRLIMVDPKMLELSVYDGIPHLLTPVVTDPKKAVVALKWAVREMEERYKKMSKLGVRNIDGYNARIAEAKIKGETLSRTVHTGYDKESGEAIYEKEEFDLDALPYLVVIVDEMADLMMVAGKDIEGAIQRLAQMARAAGIHVVLATQRPSVDVITGTIKANFPTRISFQVTSKIDSRTILGEQGAEQLLGQGDMLYMAGGGRISRVHGPFCSDEEVEKVVRHLKSQGVPQYLEAVTAEPDAEGEDGAVFDGTAMGTPDPTDLYQMAVQVVMRDRKASTSYIQRRLQIGYNRAASLMERMEKEGIVAPPNHAGKREILVEAEEHEERY